MAAPWSPRGAGPRNTGGVDDDLRTDVECHVREGLGDDLPEARVDELIALALRPLDGLPQHELEALTADPDHHVRWALVCNPTLPPEFLARFADDDYGAVRFELVVRLSEDHQLGDCASPSLPDVVPQDLLGDPESEVVWPDSPAGRALAAIRERSSELAARPGVIGAEALTAMASSSDPEVRWAVASHLACPPEVLTTLAHDADAPVRAGAAGNRGTPAAALLALASDPEECVRAVLAHNPVLPPSVLDVWTTGGMPSDPDARWSIVTHPGCPVRLLAQLAGDASADMRAQVAWHHRTSVETLATLAVDPDPEVRRTAMANPGLPDEYRHLARLA